MLSGSQKRWLLKKENGSARQSPITIERSANQAFCHLLVPEWVMILPSDCFLRQSAHPSLARRKWYGICTKCIENFVFEMILVAFSSVSRPEAWGTRFFHQTTWSGGQKTILRKMNYFKKMIQNWLLLKFLDDSTWLCMEKLKKHSCETKNQKDWPEIFKKSNDR